MTWGALREHQSTCVEVGSPRSRHHGCRVGPVCRRDGRRCRSRPPGPGRLVTELHGHRSQERRTDLDADRGRVVVPDPGA
jgi:hypothetical protein